MTPHPLPFPQILESVPQPYVVVINDPAYRIVAVTDAWLAATGSRRELVLGCELLTLVSDADALRQSLESVTRENSPLPCPSNDCALNSVNTPVFDDQHRITHIIHRLEDKGAPALVQDREQNEADRPKADFLANVSHEFRTPLTLVLGPLEQLLKRPFPLSNDIIRGSLEVAYRNALRLLRMVNGLLDLSRLDSGRGGEIRDQPTDLPALTIDLASNFRSACDQAGLVLEIDCPPLATPVQMDQEAWETIILNLMSNAFKFTFQGQISIALRASGPNILLTVSDTGIGVPASDRPHLFERFHRGTGGRSLEGSGIGLALVQQLAKARGGSVAVDSRIGVGSCFSVTVPMIQATSAPCPAAATALRRVASEETERWLANSAASDQSEAASPSIAPRILVVDDNADMRDYIGRLLQSAGYDVDAVANGAAALRAVQTWIPDLVLGDVTMPGIDGLTLLRALRAAERTAPVPVIILSARAGAEAQLEGLGAGADDYLIKPFNARELLARIEGTLRLARLRRDTLERELALKADLAARKNAEVELRAAKDAEAAARVTAEQANMAKSRFLAAASHDLCQPTQALFNFTALLTAGTLGPRERAAANNIERALIVLKGLIDALLDVSRLESRLVKPRIEAVPLQDMLDLVESDFAAQAAGRKLQLRVIPSSAVVRSDPALLGRILHNLVENAVQYTRQGGIVVGCRRRGDRIRIEVYDTGIGIAPAHQQEIFGEFVQLGNAARNRDQGLGLGLAVVRQLCDLLGHSIEVRSKPGCGTVFTVDLPLESARLSLTPMLSPPPHPACCPPSARPIP